MVGSYEMVPQPGSGSLWMICNRPEHSVVARDLSAAQAMTLRDTLNLATTGRISYRLREAGL